jgi:hypothetical protein
MTDYSDIYCLNIYKEYIQYCNAQSWSETGRKNRLKVFAGQKGIHHRCAGTLIYRGSVLHIMELKYTDDELKGMSIVLR